MKRSPRGLGRLVLLLALASLVLFATGVSKVKGPLDPIIFVHGFSGSGAQFQSQAQRFATNGYPPEYVDVVEYNSALPLEASLPDILAAIDAKIAELQALSGRPQVDLMGHSMGTTVSHAYLAFPDRAAKVAHYVNIDGRTADAPPGGVPTLALWAGGVDRPAPPEIVGASNVTIPDQEHVEVATSEEAFAEMYAFLRGRPPLTTKIKPAKRASKVSGRVVVFPDNVGVPGATLNMWVLDPSTAERVRSEPEASEVVGPDGSFGPFRTRPGRYHEFEILRGGGLLPLYAYYEPFLRDDRLVRLNTSPLLESLLPASDTATGMGILRYREFWGDRGAQNDVLIINGTNVINAINSPSGVVGAASVGFFVLDQGQDGMDDLTTVPFPFNLLAFLTGADFFIPTDPPDPITVVTVPRGDLSATRSITIRNIPSSQGRTTIQLRDFEQ